MTSNQIAWWNIQENIRSHQQNELNERNKNSITESLGDENNRISNQRMKNDFILGTQGNAISQQQADTVSRRATQDYDIGLKNVSNQATRNKQDYEIGTVSNANKAKEIANNYVIGQGNLNNQSIRNAQDYALGKQQQVSNSRQADAALLGAGAQIGKLNPAQIVVALAAPHAQKAVDATVNKVVKEVKKAASRVESGNSGSASRSEIPLNAAQKAIVTSPRNGNVPIQKKPSTPVQKKAESKSKAVKPWRN